MLLPLKNLKKHVISDIEQRLINIADVLDDGTIDGLQQIDVDDDDIDASDLWNKKDYKDANKLAEYCADYLRHQIDLLILEIKAEYLDEQYINSLNKKQ